MTKEFHKIHTLLSVAAQIIKRAEAIRWHLLLHLFRNDEWLGGMSDLTDQRGSLEKWPDRALIKFTKGKFKVLHLWRNNLLYLNGLETNFSVKDLEVLVDTKLSVKQQRALARGRRMAS